MRPIFLNVSFKDKDRAKALGARQDAVQKKWYAPENIALEPLAKWLPLNFKLPQFFAQDTNHESISLSQLLSRVSQAVPQTEWIKAEISEYHATSGHFYVDLAEFDVNQQLLCKAKAILFKGRLPPLSTKFQAAIVI